MVKKKCGPGPNSAQMGNLHKRKELSNHQICSAILSTVKPLQYFRRNASEHFRELQKSSKIVEGTFCFVQVSGAPRPHT